mgnify:CR=1 FL=1
MNTRSKFNVIQEIAVGTVTSSLVLFLGISVFALLITKEVIGEPYIGYCALVILLLSSMSGTIAIQWGTKGMHPQINLIVTAIFFLMLAFLTVIFFEGKFQGVFVTLIVVFSGYLLPALLGKQKKNKRKAFKIRNQHG